MINGIFEMVENVLIVVFLLCCRSRDQMTDVHEESVVVGGQGFREVVQLLRVYPR
jgi:hypothetical protein